MIPELATTLAPTEDDDRLLQAEALVRGFCGWHIAYSRTDTATLRGTGSWALSLRSLYVTSVNSVTSDGVAVSNDDYDWTPEGLLYARCRPWCGRAIVVSFTHGYDTPPAEVTAVVQSIARRMIQNPNSVTRTQSGPFANQFSTTGTNEAASFALLESEKAILRSYRIPAAG